MNRILEQARQLFLLSLALFFLSLTGLVLKTWFTQGPIEQVTQQLLAKDGKLLVSIASNPTLVKSLKKLLTPNTPIPPEKQPLQQAFRQLLANDGKLLVQISTALLEKPAVKSLVKDALKPSASTSGKSDNQWLVALGDKALQRLFANDGRTAAALATTILKNLPASSQKPDASQNSVALEKVLLALGNKLVETLMKQDALLARKLLGDLLKSNAGTSKSPSPDSNSLKPLLKVVEKLGDGVIRNLMVKDGKLLKELLREVLKQTRTPVDPAVAKANAKINAKVLESLGKYATDQLLASKAKPIRAILEAMVGPELMRLTRELRRTVQEIRKQTETLQLKGLVQAAAYSTSQGALETWLRNQARQKKKTQQNQRILKELQTNLWKKLKGMDVARCFLPHATPWLRLDKGTLQARVRFAKGDALKCQPMRCKLDGMMLEKKTREFVNGSALHFDAFELKIQPACP